MGRRDSKNSTAGAAILFFTTKPAALSIRARSSSERGSFPEGTAKACAKVLLRFCQSGVKGYPFQFLLDLTFHFTMNNEQ